MISIVLVHQPSKQARADYERILEELGRHSPGITGFIVDTKQENWAEAAVAYSRPAITVSPMPIKKFQPACGPVFQGVDYPKSQQYQRLRDGGIPVPGWVVIEPDIEEKFQELASIRSWGPYCVVKPDLGRKGAHVVIKRTGRLAYEADKAAVAGSRLIAQEFIYTGPWAKHYRIVTFFGRCLIAWAVEQHHGFPPLRDRHGFDAGGISIVSNKRSSSYRETANVPAIKLAEAAHGCFPEVPLLGNDIVQDADSGRWFVLECNPRGDAWHFSSAIGRLVQEQHGLSALKQFNGLQTAALCLSRVAQNCADMDLPRSFARDEN